MAYKPTPLKWVLARMAMFSAWPGLPVFLICLLLIGWKPLVSLGVAFLVVLACDTLVELIRKQNEDDGEHRP